MTGAPTRLDLYVQQITARYRRRPSDLSALGQLADAWRACAGEPLARFTHIAHFAEGRAVVYASSPVWFSKLRHQQQQLLHGLRARCPGVGLTALHLRVAPGAAARLSVRRHRVPVLSPPVRELLAASAQGIADPDLRAALQRLAAGTGDA